MARIPNRLPNFPIGTKGVFDEAHYEDNEKFFFGDDDDAAVYFDGTYWRIDGSAHELFIKLSQAATAFIYGGKTTADKLELRANIIDALPIVRLVGDGDIIWDVPVGQSITLTEASNVFHQYGRTATEYVTDATTTTAYKDLATSITSGIAHSVQCAGLTSGIGHEVVIDSDVVTSGKAYRVLSGASLNTEVFSIDENGSIQAHRPDGLSRYYREFHLGASQADPGASGATLTVLNAILSYNLNAVTEFLYYSFDVHSDWDAATDMEIEVAGYLPNAETVGDTLFLEVRADYYAHSENANTARTQTVQVPYDVANFNNQFDVNIIPLALDHDLGGNVIAAGDVVHLRIRLYDVTTGAVVTGFNVTHVNIKYKTDKPQIEA